MKTIRSYHFPVIAVFFIAALVTVSCDFPGDLPAPDDSGNPGNSEKAPETLPEGEGLLLVTLPGSGVSVNRSVLPDGLPGSLKYTLTFTRGTESKPPVSEVTGRIYTISLAAGEWTVEAKAYDPSDDLVGSGSVTVPVTAGQRVYAAILMAPAGIYAKNIYIHNEAELRQYVDDYDDDDGSVIFHLENDITVTGSDIYNLYGTFDGHGHTIDLAINDDDAFNGGGLFYENHGTVKNLRLTGTITVSPRYNYLDAGAVAGGNYGTIRNVSSAVTVTTVNTYDGAGGLKAGGITGVNNGTIEDCAVLGDVTGNRNAGIGDPNVGGIAGINETDGSINRCYASGDVSTDDSSGTIGGIVGFNKGAISNCAALNGKVSNGSGGTTFQGRVAGYNPSGTLTNNHAYGDMQIDSFSSSITGAAADKFGANILPVTLSSGSDTLWEVNPISGVLNWPSFQSGSSTDEPEGSPWYWSKTIDIPGNAVNTQGVIPAYVPALWFE